MVSPIRVPNYNVDQWLNVPPYRPKSQAPNTKIFWIEEAACQSSPADLFEPEQGDPFGGSPQKEAILAANDDKFAQARRLCNQCPVWHLCYLNATENDFYYTMRAGIEPGQYVRWKELGRWDYRVDQKLANKNTCMRGHNNWKVWGKKRPRRKCVDCDAMSPEEKRDWDAANGILGT